MVLQLHYIWFEITLLKGIKWHHFTQKLKLLIANHGLNKPGHGTIRERWLFSPDARNIAMKIHVTLFTLPLASLLEASHHVGCYDEIMRRKRNLASRFKAVGTPIANAHLRWA